MTLATAPLLSAICIVQNVRPIHHWHWTTYHASALLDLIILEYDRVILWPVGHKEV